MKKLVSALLFVVVLALAACNEAPAPTSPVAPTAVPPATIAAATPPPTVKPMTKAVGPAPVTPTGPKCDVHVAEPKAGTFVWSIVPRSGPGPVTDGKILLIPTSSGRLKAAYYGGIYTMEMEGRPEAKVTFTIGKENSGVVVSFFGENCTISNLIITVLYKTVEGQWWIRY